MADSDHLRIVRRHRNIFESAPRSDGEPTAGSLSSAVDRVVGEITQSGGRTILSAAGKPCLIPTCLCICEHGHVSYRDDNDFGQPVVNIQRAAFDDPHDNNYRVTATVKYHDATVTASRDNCPVRGHGISD